MDDMQIPEVFHVFFFKAASLQAVVFWFSFFFFLSALKYYLTC